jgi:hypothetical protein
MCLAAQHRVLLNWHSSWNIQNTSLHMSDSVLVMIVGSGIRVFSIKSLSGFLALKLLCRQYEHM